MRDVAREWEPDYVLIEDKGSGIQLIQDLKHDWVAEIGSPIAIEPEGG